MFDIILKICNIKKSFLCKFCVPYNLFRFVSICFVLFCFVSFRFVSFRFDLFSFVSICFVSFRSVSFRFVSFLFRFALYRDPTCTANFLYRYTSLISAASWYTVVGQCFIKLFRFWLIKYSEK